MSGGKISQSGLALDGDEIFIIVYFEHCLGSIHHLPNDHSGDVDRVASAVVDFQGSRFEVPDPQGNLGLHVQRVGPAQPGLPFTTDVFAKKLHHPALIRRHHKETKPADENQDADQHQNNLHKNRQDDDSQEATYLQQK